MVSVLDSILSLLGRDSIEESGSLVERAAALDEKIAVHVAMFEVMERRLGPAGLTASHRHLVPRYQCWMTVARRMVENARELRKQGQTVSGTDDLVRAINHAKPVAEDFEETVALNERITRGEGGKYIPLAEIRNELRA
jgi:hypothetical protein